jgi:uncharacterized protein YydD (DUF2326 family)
MTTNDRRLTPEDQVKLEASRIAHEHHVKLKSEMRAAKQSHTQDDEAKKLTTDLGVLLNRQVFKRTAKLAGFAEFCSAPARKKLTTALTELRDHIDALINRTEGASK